MSSWYHIYCLSHEPALDTLVEWNSGTNNPAAAERAASTPVPGHDGCDLVVVQSSGAPCSVSDSTKRHARWDDVAWLRLLHAAHGVLPDEVLAPLARRWPRERLLRLREVLDLPEAVPVPPAAGQRVLAYIHTDPESGAMTKFKPAEITAVTCDEQWSAP